MTSPKQQAIIDLLQTRVSMTAAEIAAAVKSEVKATSKHLRLLEDMGKIYVCEWRKGKHGVPTKAYTLGEGESVVLVNKRKSQNERRKEANKRNTYDPYAPILANNGWVSTIHSWDRSVSQHDHLEFIKRFQPHPDYASAWLFHEPRVELLGARYD
jgi:DNA-binding transcriptional ArsR family regulator